MLRSENKRLSLGNQSFIPISVLALNADEYRLDWDAVYARDLIDTRIVSIDADTSVEKACEVLLSEDIPCLVVKSSDTDLSGGSEYLGLFDYADVNAFLTLAATRHTLRPEDLQGNPRVAQIVSAAHAGREPVRLLSDLSEKNPLYILPNDATIISLLQIFSRGTHRVLVRAPDPSHECIGMVTDFGLLSWFCEHCDERESLSQLASYPLGSLGLPCLNIKTSVVSANSSDTVLDAMKLMSQEGVSSIAIMDEDAGTLLSAVSVTDIGKIVVPSESKNILTTPLSQFVSQVKAQQGSTDGVDKYPVYSVYPTTSLRYTVQMILATKAHRLFVTTEATGSAPPIMSYGSPGYLSGLVSIVDILSLFARLANIPNVDPTHMQRKRRASSASTSSSTSDGEQLVTKLRSSSRNRSKRFSMPPTYGVIISEPPPTIAAGADPIQPRSRRKE